MGNFYSWGGTTLVSGGIFSNGMGLAIVNAFAKFKEHSFIHSGNIEGVLKLKKSRDQEDGGNFYP